MAGGQVNSFRADGKAVAALTGGLGVKRVAGLQNGFTPVTAQGEIIDGVVEYDAPINTACAVITYGEVEVTAGGTVAAAVPVTVTAAGKFETALVGDFVAGKSLEAGTLDNPMRIFLDPSRVAIPV